MTPNHSIEFSPLFFNSKARLRGAFYGREAHESIGQVRKYSGDRYWTHTERVAVALINAGVDDDDMIVAALLHDVLEDVYPKNPQYSLSDITKKFGQRAAKFVVGLTDVYTKEAYPDYNRKERHKQELARLVLESDEVKTIKASDMADNTADILVNDPKFAVIYLGEKKIVMNAIFPVATRRYQIVINKLLENTER